LSAYVRDGKIFTRPSPNVFGLVEFGATTPAMKSAPPPEFGKDDDNLGIPWLTDEEVKETA
jgi:hypothetical protein